MKNNYISYEEHTKICDYFNTHNNIIVYTPDTFEPRANYIKVFNSLQVSNIDEFWEKIKQLEIEGWNKETIKDFYKII